MLSLESIAALKKDGLDGIIDNADDRKAIINAAKRKVKVTWTAGDANPLESRQVTSKAETGGKR